MKACILVVALDAQARAMLARWLLGAGYAVELAESPRRAREVIANTDIALAIVAPHGLGSAAFELTRQLDSRIGHLIVVEDETGASAASAGTPVASDARISWPLREPDVLARVKSALDAAARKPSSDPQLFHLAGYTLDADQRVCVDADGREVSLTRAEFSLLLALASQPGRVLSRDELARAAIGRDLESDDRSIDVLISRLRRKIEPDPKTPRIIVTAPGRGYELAAKPQAALPTATKTPPPFNVVTLPVERDPKEVAAQETTSVTALAPHRRLIVGSFRGAAIGAAAAALVGMTALAVALWHSGSMTRTPGPAAPVQKFDAAVVPLVIDAVRGQLANYEHLPGAKAIAISREGWGTSSGAADDEAAKSEALDRCRERDKGGFCRIYAIGDNVVWPKATLPLPLPADIRADGSPMTSVTADSLSKLWQTVWHVPLPRIASGYPSDSEHKAIAVALAAYYVAAARLSRAEAGRMAIERCSDMARAPCLLLAIDGDWTVRIPQFRPITGPFTLAGEFEMSDAERERIAQVYAGKEWRALARGRSGRWYAVDARQTEAAAVDDVLKMCRASESECALHAIGNWRVASNSG